MPAGKVILAQKATSRPKYIPRIRKYRKVYRKKNAPIGFYSKDPFPPSMIRNLHYTDTVRLTAGASGVFGTEKLMKLNGLYDPDHSGVGHQPYGFDTMASIYSTYKVTKCTVILEWTDPSTDGMTVAYLMTAPYGTTTLTGKTYGAAAENPQISVKAINNTGSQRLKQVVSIPMHKLFGITPLQFNANVTDYASNMTADPLIYGLIRLAAGRNGGETGGTIDVNIKIIYTAQFYNRKTLAQS